MPDLLFVIEGVLGAIVAIGLTYLLTSIGRRRAIARGALLTMCAYAAEGATSWRRGLLRFGSGSVEWFPMAGLSVRPRYRWARRQLDLGSATPQPDGARLDLIDPVRVECRHADETFRLAMARDAYMALRIWVEAAPPGGSATVH